MCNETATGGPTPVNLPTHPPSAEAKCLVLYMTELFGGGLCNTLALGDKSVLTAVPASVAPVPASWQTTHDEEPPEDVLMEQPALMQPEDAEEEEHATIALPDSQQIGLQFFNEAMTRLQLQNDMQAQAAKVQALVDGLNPLEGLENEKARVKAELKSFDVSFEKRFNRPPVRQEKEPLRPCYMYYRRLKWAIKQVEGQTEQQTQALCVQMIPNDVELQLERLQLEKSTVRAAIQRFQEDFIKTHGRPIKYHKDVVKMENEYSQYKQLRNRIAKLEDVLRRRRALQASLRSDS